MGKIFISYIITALRYFFKTLTRSFKGCYGFIKISFIHSHILAYPLCARKVVQIMRSKHFYRHRPFGGFKIRHPVLYCIFRSMVWQFTYRISRSFCYTLHFRVIFVIDQNTAIGYLLNKNFELFYIVFIRREYIDMIPGYTAYQGNIGLI